MLCRKFKNILVIHPTNNSIIYRPLVQTRSFSKCFDILSGKNMSPTVRLKLFRELFLTRLVNAWTRSYTVNSLFKRCRTERGVNKMFLYFRQVFFRPRTQLLVSATATIKNTEEKPGPPKKCSRNIKDKEMKRLIRDLDRVEDLSKATLYCEDCDKRLVIDSKHKGVQYCDCPHSSPPVGVYDGWVPYMEAEDVIIWRKEYKPGGLYAYKVYGRYQHLKAEDFAMIQVDGAYRKVWDSAVASISVVEREANGVKDQTVLHWEVLWPRLFANRDYVYLRRHKEFDVKTRCLTHKDGIFPSKERCVPDPNYKDRGSCHGKVTAQEAGSPAPKQTDPKQTEPVDLKENKVYVIVSRSCVHPDVPETKKAIRVEEYWSHMVITTLNGPDHPGMEFVLTYYDEPAVGGLPTAVTSWAMGRAGPAFLERMRGAARDYAAWRSHHPQETPDFTPFGVSYVSPERLDDVREGDKESSLQGPELEEVDGRADNSTQTKPVLVTPLDDDPRDGPKVEQKYASKELEGTVERPDDGPQKYELLLTTTAPPEDEERLRTLDGSAVHNLNISVSEMDRLPDDSDDDVTIRAESPKALVSEPVGTYTDTSVKTLVNDPLQTHVDEPVKRITTNIVADTNGPAYGTEREDSDSNEGDKEIVVQERTTWWRYLYPLYYFV